MKIHGDRTGFKAGAETDEDGRYSIPGLPPDNYRIVVEATGYLSQEASFTASPKESSSIEKSLFLDPSATLRGTVVDAGRQPIAGARVAFNQEDLFKNRNGAYVTATDEKGVFALAVPACLPPIRPFRVYALKSGYAWSRSAPLALRPGVVDGIKICLLAGASLSGQVTDPEGKPYSKAYMGLFPLNVRSASLLDSSARFLLGDENGYYRFTAVSPGKYRVRASWGNRTEYRSEIKVSEGEAVWGIDLVLLERALIQGRVMDSGGRPIPEVEVNARSRIPEIGRPLNVRTRTDEKGFFRLEGLRTAPGTLWFSRSGYTSTVFRNVKIGPEKRDWTVTLHRLPGIRGQVLAADGRTPARSFRINVYLEDKGRPRRHMTRPFSSPDGHFMVDGYHNRPCRLRLEACTPDGQVSGQVPVDIIPDAVLDPLMLVLQRGGCLECTVTTPNGCPARGATVHVQGQTTGWNEGIHIDASGRFRLAGLPPDVFRIIATHPAHVSNVLDVAVARGMRVKPAISLLVDGGTVRLTIRNTDGQPVCAAKTWFYHPSGIEFLHYAKYRTLFEAEKKRNPDLDYSAFLNGAHQTDNTGCLTRRFLTPVHYRIQVVAQGYKQAWASVTVEAGVTRNVCMVLETARH